MYRRKAPLMSLDIPAYSANFVQVPGPVLPSPNDPPVHNPFEPDQFTLPPTAAAEAAKVMSDKARKPRVHWLILALLCTAVLLLIQQQMQFSRETLKQLAITVGITTYTLYAMVQTASQMPRREEPTTPAMAFPPIPEQLTEKPASPNNTVSTVSFLAVTITIILFAVALRESLFTPESLYVSCVTLFMYGYTSLAMYLVQRQMPRRSVD